MKTLHLLLIMFTVIIFLGFGLQPVHADDANGISIQNIKVQPSTVKVGDTFTVTATLVNNSTVPIVLDSGKCSIEDTQVPFFTVMFDNHAKSKSKNINCAGVGWSQILNPGKNIIGTSPDYTLVYIATKSGTTNVTVTFSYHVTNQTDPTQPNLGQTISKSFLFTIYDNNTGTKTITETVLSPLKQFKSGIAANDVKCQQDLRLVIKSEDGSTACVKPQTAQKLVERGWGWAMQTIDSLKPLLPNRIIGLENDTGVVTFGNRTYYFETPHYTQDAYVNPMQISFHDVLFTLFLSGFKGGLPTSGGCGSGTVGELVVGGGSYYWTDAKFSDGIHELLHIFADSKPCPVHPTPTYFSNHTNLQAGLTFYDGKMKLLVSTNVTNSTEHLITPSTNQTSNVINKTSTITKLTVHYYGGSGSINIGSDKFNQTVFFTGNVGQVKAGSPVQVSISDPYDMFIRKYTIPSNEIAQDGSFIFAHMFLGRYDQDIYTLDFSYGDQRYELKYYPVVPP
ncbi:MAG: hypothetical protein HY223_08540 [Thaumarchaeota archaeon]|nr:hypothetical protein [Nitrososphaerota archaeon]